MSAPEFGVGERERQRDKTCVFVRRVNRFHSRIAICRACEMAPASSGGLAPGMRHPGCETIDMHEACRHSVVQPVW